MIARCSLNSAREVLLDGSHRRRPEKGSSADIQICADVGSQARAIQHACMPSAMYIRAEGDLPGVRGVPLDA